MLMHSSTSMSSKSLEVGPMGKVGSLEPTTVLLTTHHSVSNMSSTYLLGGKNKMHDDKLLIYSPCMQYLPTPKRENTSTYEQKGEQLWKTHHHLGAARISSSQCSPEMWSDSGFKVSEATVKPEHVGAVALPCAYIDSAAPQANGKIHIWLP